MLSLIIIQYTGVYKLFNIILPYKAKRVYLSERLKIFILRKKKKMYFGVFLKHYLRRIALNHMKINTFNKSFIIYLMM